MSQLTTTSHHAPFPDTAERGARHTEPCTDNGTDAMAMISAFVIEDENILIVDDTPGNLAVVVASLEERGFRVAIAQDGEEGLQRAEFMQPRLILLDVLLPGMDGIEMCRRLKANAHTRDIPVIFMTALSEPEDKLRGFEAGGVDYVTKPLQIDEVAARVDLHLKLHALQQQLEERNAQLQEHRAQLEQHVMERTADLHESNRRLREEIGERKRLEELLREREQEFRTLSENLPDPVIRYDLTGRRIYLNPSAERILGIPASALLQKSPEDLSTSNSALFYCQKIREVLETGRPAAFEFCLDWLAGRPPEDYHVQMAPEYGADGRIAGVLAIGRDITVRKGMENELHKREQEFRGLVENSPDTIARYDRDCRRVYANPRLANDLGGDMTRILGVTPSQMPGGARALEYENMIREVYAQRQERKFELRWHTDDAEFCTHISMTPEFDYSGQVTHVLAVGRDITEIDRYRRKIHRQAFFDALTDLPNRALLSDRIGQAIAGAAYHGHQFGLMMLDLDHFKAVNDALGHGAGDRLLCDAAQRLRKSVRADDTVARLGGDEFAVLLPEIRDAANLNLIAGKILQVLAEPFLIEGKEIFVSASIGIALYPGDSADIDSLYKYADSAMYHAKKQGRNNFQFYARELTVRASDRLEMEAALHKACRKGELALYYQPQIELQTGRVIGAEALLRWNRPGYGQVMPNRFIPIAEETGLIVEIGEWVLRTACMTAASWNRERATPLRLAINLSTRQFMRNDLVGAVRRILAETDCKPQWLELEITESLLLEDSSEVAAMLAELHGMGLTITIDDFGTGYSALSYLNRFPVGQLKIDRSFVKDIPEDRSKCELVKAILSISVALRLEAVAEGVETPAQAAYLMAYGCRVAQGYLYGKPMPRVAFETLLAQESGSCTPLRNR